MAKKPPSVTVEFSIVFFIEVEYGLFTYLYSPINYQKKVTTLMYILYIYISSLNFRMSPPPSIYLAIYQVISLAFQRKSSFNSQGKQTKTQPAIRTAQHNTHNTHTQKLRNCPASAYTGIQERAYVILIFHCFNLFKFGVGGGRF
ncbi:hypothetical protein L211DRAFT_646227 [Terfezia boudieri ATCC MYA-4762]|uniref:Uncharacterized protein n=1 Tax=Terfezia boudieri ATCC MYA-4762 TaxID=1051890 RepID=A0A3N4LUT7_9PEZI|nr:hypothetical protein L211DRAFT_646227 [Terfezia boudieri ATCC MYA-4762]